MLQLSHSRRTELMRLPKGFTLLEAMVAVTILGGGIVGVIGAIGLASQRSASALREAEAATVAQNQMILAVGATSDALEPAEGDQGPYRWKLTYNGIKDDLVRATIEVMWHDRNSQEIFRLHELFVPRTGGS